MIAKLSIEKVVPSCNVSGTGVASGVGVYVGNDNTSVGVGISEEYLQESEITTNKVMKAILDQFFEATILQFFLFGAVPPTVECRLCWLAFACQILTLEKVFIFCYGIGGKTWKEAMTAEYKFSNSENQSARGSQGKK